MTRGLVCWSGGLDFQPLPLQYRHISLKRIAQFVALDLEVVSRLQTHPECLGSAEIPGEAQSGVCGDTALTMHNLVDAPGRRYCDNSSGSRNSRSKISPG
jgi:hypothetical protein